VSLKKKIMLSFFISAAVIAVLAAFEYFSFIEIRREIRYLEITDTINRLSLQLRRHEKNYFLYSPVKAEQESVIVHFYLRELREILAKNPGLERNEQPSLHMSIQDYERRFNEIEAGVTKLQGVFDRTTASSSHNEKIFSLIEDTFIERPEQSAEYIEQNRLLPHGHMLLAGLRRLDADIRALRKTGEDILFISRDLDKVARERAETVISVSQLAILVIFPVFFIVGIGLLFFIGSNVVQRLRLLIAVVEKTGKGTYTHLIPPSPGKAPDEVGVLIDKFNTMEDELSQREAELDRKNKELIHTKKLAAIGTLAAGVAHELNNPLNNIHLSAQVLSKEVGEYCSPSVQEAVSDIVGQTIRVKGIVADLLEFARGREPRIQAVHLTELIEHVYKKLAVDKDNIRFTLDAGPSDVVMMADPEQMERVFINLFRNAIEAMPQGGELAAAVQSDGEAVTIRISDTGRGLPRNVLDKVFEPFFTTKDKGTGLGLAIVFNIIKKHYGEIHVASEEGKGTQFTITMPKESP